MKLPFNIISMRQAVSGRRLNAVFLMAGSESMTDCEDGELVCMEINE